MLKKLFILMAAIGFVLSAASVNAEQTVILSNGEYPPFFSQSLQNNGIGSHIIREAFALEGISVEYEYMPWKRALTMTRDGYYDGAVGFRTSPKREETFFVSDPVLHIETVVFHRMGDQFDWKKLEDLASLKIGATNGYLIIDILKPLVKQHGGKLDIALTDIINMKKLLAGRIDIFPCEKKVGLHLLRTHFTPEQMQQISFHPKPLLDNKLHVLFSRNKASGSQLRESFNRGLKKLREKESYAQHLEECYTHEAIP
ncbi:transporter substrate-binding domain-containing protein [uncultured Pseudodesulfovibrio sp.]|uniref:substrate-binding periplasmic protein n=1 Tax=uncultured Pseudodesulfovibrio sp. TaxID=2035858 RepID=UPI0029C7274F|nr:transporter substrate-binding domain-containing protein [uncultured Pseudodesulfovibrio sp.]